MHLYYTNEMAMSMSVNEEAIRGILEEAIRGILDKIMLDNL